MSHAENTKGKGSGRTSPALVYAATLVLAACSLLYELLIAQALSTLARNTVVWYSVTIGIYLAAMGIGALLHDKYGTQQPWARLFRVELLLSAVGAGAIPLLYLAHTCATLLAVNGFSTLSDFFFFGSAFGLTTVIGVLSGFELPLLIDLGNAASKEQRVTNRVLASDYMGSLLGGMSFPLLLLPVLSLFLIGLLTASLNFVVALLVLYWFLPVGEKPARRLLACGSLATVLVLGLVFAGPIDRYFVKNYYFYFNNGGGLISLLASMENAENVSRERSPYQRIDIVYRERGYNTDPLIDAYSSKFTDNPSQPKNYLLFLNGDFQVLSSYEEFYHEYFAHVPIITNAATPRRVLVMGAGDGLLIRELVKYPDIERILQVDLDEKLVTLAREHPVLVAMNENALDDPRVETVYDDAFRYIRNSTEQFDAIFLDFPYVSDYNLSKLYSREFYHFVRKHLAPGGFVALDSPGIASRARPRQIQASTLLAAGFEYVIPYSAQMEEYNQAAAEILQEQGVPQDAIERFLAAHAQSLRHGFVIARDDRPPSRLYHDPRVKLHALNQQRLELTLKQASELKYQFNRKSVNSIFLPTLPEGEIWGIRTPW